METITITKQEYQRKMFEAYKEGFKSAIDTLQGAFAAVEEAAKKNTQSEMVTLSPIERDWSGEEEDKAWEYLQKFPRSNTVTADYTQAAMADLTVTSVTVSLDNIPSVQKSQDRNNLAP